jgi:hypothetical protein
MPPLFTIDFGGGGVIYYAVCGLFLRLRSVSCVAFAAISPASKRARAIFLTHCGVFLNFLQAHSILVWIGDLLVPLFVKHNVDPD